MFEAPEIATRLTFSRVAFQLSSMMSSFKKSLFMWCVFVIAWAPEGGAAQFGIVKKERVNVRSRATISSEVLTQLNTGDKVEILESVILSETVPGNPKEWFRIVVPQDVVLWVSEDYIDAAENLVTATRLNVRAGPHQKFKVVARLNRGDKVETLKQSEGWISIKPPRGAVAYVAADLVDLTSDSPEKDLQVLPSITVIENPDETKGTDSEPVLIIDKPGQGESVVIEGTVLANQPDDATAAQAQLDSSSPSPAVAVSDPIDPLPETSEISITEETLPLQVAEVEEDSSTGELEDTQSGLTQIQGNLPELDLPKLPPVIGADRLPAEVVIAENPNPEIHLRRIITREGIVKRSRSIQSPTYHRLEDPVTHRTMNYLYTGRLHLHTRPSPADLKPYEGYKIQATGQESVDARWPRIPVIEIEELRLAE
jgi:uncharacterized protein YgiM (DUF1202 family)